MKNSQVADFNSWYKKNKLNVQDNDYKFNQERADRNRNYNTDWKSEDLVMLIDATQPWLQPIKWGDIYMVMVNCFWNRDSDYYQGGDPNYWKGKLEKDGGTLFTQFSHFLDTMYWLFGDIKNIKATFNQAIMDQLRD